MTFSDNSIDIRSNSAKERRLSIWASVASVSIFFIFESLRFAKLIKLPTQKLVGFVPDDAFYYFVLAKNFAEVHRWTFDRVAPATGFHPFWAYILAGIYALQPHIAFPTLFTVLFCLSSLLAGTSLLLLCLVVTGKLGNYAVVGPLAVFLSLFVIYLPNELMEASFVLFFASLVVYLVSGKMSRQRMIAACACGFLGMLSRSDFGMLPVALFATSLMFRSDTWKLSAAVLLGALLGLGAIVLHNEAISGHALQGSTRIKRSWSLKENDNIRNSVAHTVTPLVYSVTFPWQPTPLRKGIKRTVLLVSLALFIWNLLKVRTSRSMVALIIAMLVVPLGYVYLYKFDSSAIQPWYSANFAIPYSILFAFMASFRVALLRVTVSICLFALAAHGIVDSFDPWWPAQEGSVAAAEYIKKHPELGTVGAWNAGVLQFFSEGRVANIDGLVNDDVTGFILADNLSAYLSQRQISTVVDDDAMLSASYFRNRGGYSEDSLTHCIDKKQQIWLYEPYRGPGDNTVLVQFDRQCLTQ